jgi:hypothetical protein
MFLRYLLCKTGGVVWSEHGFPADALTAWKKAGAETLHLEIWDCDYVNGEITSRKLRTFELATDFARWMNGELK